MTETHFPFACANCGQAGNVTYRGEGVFRVTAGVSAGFHIEEGRMPGGRNTIVCSGCDEIDPERAL